MPIINNERYAKYYHKLGVIYERPEIKASLEVIFSVFMVLILVFAAIRPTLTNLAALQKKIVDKESLNTKADKKIAQLFIAQEQLAQYASYLNLFDSAVTEKFSYSDMTGRVELVARNNNLNIETISVLGAKLFGDGKPKGEWSTKILNKDTDSILMVPVDFQVSGKPKQIRQFMIDVENIDRLTTVKSVNLVKESGTAKGGEKVRAYGQINFYILDISK